MEDISIDEVSMKLLSAYGSQIQSALKISEILAEHADEDTISPDNIILGLIYRLMVVSVLILPIIFLFPQMVAYPIAISLFHLVKHMITP